jgi:deoxyguanosine kinase
LEQLSLDYETAMNEFERQHPDVPVIRFNGDDLDFVKNEADLKHIFDTLSTSLKKRSIQL